MADGDPTPTPSPTPVPVKPNSVTLAALKFWHASLTGLGHIWMTNETQAYEKALKRAEALPEDD